MRKKIVKILIVTGIFAAIAGCQKEGQGAAVPRGAEAALKVSEELANEPEENEVHYDEKIELSDTQYLEINYGNMELSENAFTGLECDGLYRKSEITDFQMITGPETAKDIAICMAQPYFDKYPEMNFHVWVQYIPDLGYYLIDFIDKESWGFGYSVEMVLDERDARVVKLWELNDGP